MKSKSVNFLFNRVAVFGVLLLSLALRLVVPVAHAGPLYTNVYAFSGGADGGNPVGELIQGTDGYFYGVTANGGVSNSVAVFKLGQSGSFTALYSFTGGADGGNPLAGLVFGADGRLYGTTSAGGDGYGTVFKIDTNGALTTLYAFGSDGVFDEDGSPADGAKSVASLVLGQDGNFYGTTSSGGNLHNEYGGDSFVSVGSGTVFKITPTGNFTTLHSFTGADGACPEGNLVQARDGSFYGTSCGGDGWPFTLLSLPTRGTVFKISADGSFSNLYIFGNPIDSQGIPVNGQIPAAGLTIGGDGSFYGTTAFGGSVTNAGGYSVSYYGPVYYAGGGTVFRVTTNGALTTLYSFTGNSDGSEPAASLTGTSAGVFYGVDSDTVFQITTGGALTILHTFSGTDGSPTRGLLLGSDGNLYGATYNGGTNGAGVVFRLTPPPVMASVSVTNGSVQLTWSTRVWARITSCSTLPILPKRTGSIWARPFWPPAPSPPPPIQSPTPRNVSTARFWRHKTRTAKNLPGLPASPFSFSLFPSPFSLFNALVQRDHSNKGSSDNLVGAVYSELRRLAAHYMAGEGHEHTLQPTALVHEAWLRVSREDARRFEDSRHFLAVAAQTMRRILVDRARRRNAAKRGAGRIEVDVLETAVAAPAADEPLLAVNEALERLATLDSRKAELVQLRYFAGLSFEEAAAVLGISVPTANRWWAFSRAWLLAEIKDPHGTNLPS